MIGGDFKWSNYFYNYSGETLAGIIFGLLIVVLVIFLLVMLMVFKYKDPNRFNFNGGRGSNINGNGDHTLPPGAGNQGDPRSALAGYTTVTATANGGTAVTYGTNGNGHPPGSGINSLNHNSSHGSSFNLFNRFIHSSGPYVSRLLTLESSSETTGNSNTNGNGNNLNASVTGSVNSTSVTTSANATVGTSSVDSVAGQCPLGSTSSVTPMSTIMSNVNSKTNQQSTTISSVHLNSSPNGKLNVNEPANHLIIGNKNHVHGHLMDQLAYNSRTGTTMQDSPPESLTTSSSITKSNWLTSSNSDDVQNGQDILRITVNPTDSLGTTDSSGLGSTTGTSSSSSTEQSTTDRSGSTVTSMSTTAMNSKECQRMQNTNVTNGIDCTSSSSTSSIASTAIVATGPFVGDTHRLPNNLSSVNGYFSSGDLRPLPPGAGTTDGNPTSKLHHSMIQSDPSSAYTNKLLPLDMKNRMVLTSTLTTDEDMDDEEIYSKRPTVKALVIQDALAKSNLAASASPIYESFHGRSRLLHSINSTGHGLSEFNPLYVNHHTNSTMNSLTGTSPYGTIGRYNSRRFSDRSYPLPHPHLNHSSHQAFPVPVQATTTAMAVNQIFYPNSISSTNQPSVTSSSSSSSLLLHHQNQPVASASSNATSAAHLLRMKQLQVQQQQIQHQLDQVLARGTTESPYGSIIRKSNGQSSNLTSTMKDATNDVYSVPYGSLHRTYSASLVNSLIKSTPSVVPVIPNSSAEPFISNKTNSTKEPLKDQQKPG